MCILSDIQNEKRKISSHNKKWPDAHRMMKSYCLLGYDVQIMQRRHYFIIDFKMNLTYQT